MKKQIIGGTFAEERALYACRDAEVFDCVFEGEADGESPLKESRGVAVKNCRFALRYPMWHCEDILAWDCHFTEGCRAPFWYSDTVTLRHCKIEGVKAIRECGDVLIEDTLASSAELGWKCHDVIVRNSRISSEYLFFECSSMKIRGLSVEGKYSFQYVNDAEIFDSSFDTKDAFWHSKNVVVYDSEIKGEYLGWYSENLTLVNCKISGTQPFCYCKGLKLIDCTLDGCDLSFEYSEVEAQIKGRIESVKNPLAGYITADEIGEIIIDDEEVAGKCKITEREADGQ